MKKAFRGEVSHLLQLSGAKRFFIPKIPPTIGQHLLNCNEDFVSIIQGIEVVYLFLCVNVNEYLSQVLANI